MPSVLVDTGIWYALFDPKDRTVTSAVLDQLQERIEPHTVIVPWPIVYETLRSSFVKNRLALGQFEQRLKSPRIEFIDDFPYRDSAFLLSLNSSLRGGRPLSMVDCILRIILDDTDVKISYLATFNVRDFVDVCANRNVELWP